MLLTTHTPLQKIVNFYVNNRTESTDDPPPVQIGKRWNTRLVVDHFFHEEIERAVAKVGPSSSEWIGAWQTALTSVVDRLEQEKKLTDYQMMAEKWNTTGPPEDIKKR